MIFAGSDSEMISKLAKSIAHFFVVQNIMILSISLDTFSTQNAK